MRLIWKIISNLILILVFIALSIFSLVEYRGDNINSSATDDKLTLAKTTLTNISYLAAYLEKMPTIRLLPVVTNEAQYQKQILDSVVVNQDKIPSIKENISDVKLKAGSNLTSSVSWSEIMGRLKSQLSKDWFRP